MPRNKTPTYQEILAHFSQRDPVMHRAILDFGPFQLKRNRNYFIVLCKAIIAQQISNGAAKAITDRFIGLLDGCTPTPERVAALSAKTLGQAGLSRQKTAYLQDLSRHFLERRIRPHQLRHLENEVVIEQLTQVHGIGRWTAEMFLIFSLNRMDILPVRDLGLVLAVKSLYHMRSTPTPKKLRTLGKKWHPFETVATWYAWRTRDANIVAY